MPVYYHSECCYPVDRGPVTPMECPAKEIPQCPNPTLGFDIRCSQANPKVWKCNACGWLIRSEEEPESCPAGSIPVCPNPTGGEFTKICD